MVTVHLYASIDPKTAQVGSLRIVGDENPTGRAGEDAPVLALLAKQSADTYGQARDRLLELIDVMPNLRELWRLRGEGS